VIGVTNQRSEPKVSQEEIEELLAQSLAEPGVAAAIDAYEYVEDTYSQFATALYQPAYASNSTSVEPSSE
jgi:hypothetical protein